MRAWIFSSLVWLLLPDYLSAFVPIPRIEQRVVSVAKTTKSTPESAYGRPVVIATSRERINPLQHQRQTVARVQTMGLFGLGGLEIAVILVGVGVVLGPERILEMVRSSGDTADEYKKELSKVPSEFKKGMEEGEIEARSRKAKVMKKTTNSNDDAEIS